MRVLIAGKPFQFQSPNNGPSVRRLCQELRMAGFDLRPQILRAQTGAVPREIQSRTTALLNDRTVEGRLALLQWLVQAPVELEPSEDAPVTPASKSNGVHNGHTPPPFSVVVHRGSTPIYVRLPPRDRSMGLYDLVGLCRAEGLQLHPRLSARLGNSRHNRIQALDARFRRCTRPEVLAEILGQVLDPAYKIETPGPIAMQELVPRGAINLIIDGRSIVMPAIRTLRQVRGLCDSLNRAGHRIKPVHGTPPFASSEGERRQVMILLKDASNPEGARRLVEWLVDATEVRVA